MISRVEGLRNIELGLSFYELEKKALREVFYEMRNAIAFNFAPRLLGAGRSRKCTYSKLSLRTGVVLMVNNRGSMAKVVLLTGGCGYIGSHVCVELIKAGYKVVVIDNLSNSSQSVLSGVAEIIGQNIVFEEGDIRDGSFLRDVIGRHRCSAVVHFAGLKSVGESVGDPLKYYDNNVCGTVQLIEAMQATGVKRLIFSSSATVYGEPIILPIDESHPRSATNPYGRTKLIIEDMLRELWASDEAWRICMLRYFNPAGAHESGRIGEEPSGTPNNLVPFISQVASGIRKGLCVWGADYPTHDGTGVRDYIHVVDLAKGHVRALDVLDSMACAAINLGVGRGYSVLDVVQAFERASGVPIPYELCDRRTGDVASCYANASLAAQLLGWRATRDLDDICRDAWRWQLSSRAQGPKG